MGVPEYAPDTEMKTDAKAEALGLATAAFADHADTLPSGNGERGALRQQQVTDADARSLDRKQRLGHFNLRRDGTVSVPVTPALASWASCLDV